MTTISITKQKPILSISVGFILALGGGCGAPPETFQSETMKKKGYAAMQYEEGIEILEKYMEEEARNKHEKEEDVQKSIEDRVKHSEAVAAFAYQIAKEIKADHPEKDVDPEKVRLGGLLHDIGRGVREGDHEENSVKILNDLGHSELAKIVMHGRLYEKRFLQTGHKDAMLLPHTLENKIVASDLLT